MLAALYVRVSTEEQKKFGFSVDAQIDGLKKYCEENNITIYRIYNDAGISARKSYKKRPDLLRMIEDAQADRFDIILFTKLDRFFRSVKDYYECIAQLNNKPWRTIWEDYETETSTGMFKVNIMLSVAQNEADKTSERIKQVFEYKRSQGYYPTGTIPYGYRLENGRLLIDEETKAIVRGAFDCYLATYNRYKVHDYLEENGHLIALSSVNRMLKNPAYSGKTKSGVECPAYITKEESEKILKSFEIRRQESSVKNKDYEPFIFRGVLRCAHCGAPLCGTSIYVTTKAGTRVKRKRYRCTTFQNFGTKKCINTTTRVEPKIERYLLANLDESLKDYKINAKIKKKPAKKIDKSNYLKRLERLKDMYEFGDIERDEYINKRDSIKKILSEADEQQREEKEIVLPTNWKDIYMALDADHRRAFWIDICEQITIDKDFNITIYFKSV